MGKTDVRPAALAGTWYSEDAARLKNTVDAYIHAAEIPQLEGKVIGLLAPHAGHHYSGPVAGYAYKPVLGAHFDTVVVISPYHRSHLEPILTTRHSAYTTPLGNIAVDQDNLSKLDQHLTNSAEQQLFFIRNDIEHAVEIELPFLQCALAAPFKLLPLMLATHSLPTALRLGQALADILAGQNILLVASTDLSHFYPEETANTLDTRMLDAFATFDIAEVVNVQEKGEGQACGLLAVLAVMKAAEGLGAKRMQVLKYATSGTTSGDYSRVVGYGAGVFLG